MRESEYKPKIPAWERVSTNQRYLHEREWVQTKDTCMRESKYKPKTLVWERVGIKLITDRNVVAARLCFHRRLWFCSGRGVCEMGGMCGTLLECILVLHVKFCTIFLTVLKWFGWIPMVLFTYDIKIHKKIKGAADKKLAKKRYV